MSPCVLHPALLPVCALGCAYFLRARIAWPSFDALPFPPPPSPVPPPRPPFLLPLRPIFQAEFNIENRPGVNQNPLEVT